MSKKKLYPVKPDCEASSSEPYYDLVNGYLKPEKILVNPEDVAEVKAALTVLKKFFASCEQQIEDFLQ